MALLEEGRFVVVLVALPGATGAIPLVAVLLNPVVPLFSSAGLIGQTPSIALTNRSISSLFANLAWKRLNSCPPCPPREMYRTPMTVFLKTALSGSWSRGVWARMAGEEKEVRERDSSSSRWWVE